MTKHERRIAEYPWRIARKRLNRRRSRKIHRTMRKVDIKRLRSVLEEYVRMHPAPEPIRAGKPTMWNRAKNFFRKPTI